MSGLRPRSLPALPCAAFPAVPGRWEKGEVRPEKHPSRGSGKGGARGGVGLWGGRSSSCRCHCYRRCHIGSLLYRQPLQSCDRSRAAVTTVRSRPRERARARPRLPRGAAGRASRAPGHRATPLPFRSPPLFGSMRVWEVRLQPASGAGRSNKPTVKICLRKRNLIHPGRFMEHIMTACEAPGARRG